MSESEQGERSFMTIHCRVWNAASRETVFDGIVKNGGFEIPLPDNLPAGEYRYTINGEGSNYVAGEVSLCDVCAVGQDTTWDERRHLRVCQQCIHLQSHS